MTALRLLPLLAALAFAACGDDGAPPIDADPQLTIDAASAPDAGVGADGAAMDAGGVDARSLGNGAVCVSADGGPIDGVCGTGLVCCYPCGIPGCDSVCQAPCDGGPGCEGGCPLLP